MSAKLEAIFVTPAARARPASADRAAVVLAGIEGDRYALQTGTFSGSNLKDGRAVSMIAAEALEDLPQFADGQHRRNLVVRGLDLAALRGKQFTIGSATFRCVRTCPPCGYLSKLVGVDAKQLLLRKGGVRVDVIVPGVITVGDDVIVS